MEKSIRQFQEAVQEFRELVDKARRRKAHTRDVLINAFNQMDKRIHKMHTSDVFRVLIQPSEPAAFERMHHALKSAIRTSDLNKRLEIAVEQVLPYFEKCVGHLSKIRQMVHWIHRQLDINTDTEVYYPNHCGAYQYTGTWERSVQFRLSGESEIRRFRMKSAKRGASIQFLVKGSGLTLYFDHMETKARKIQLSVDGKEKAVPFIQMETEHGEWIYRMDRLNEERETRIELKLTEDEAVAFNGISMPLGGRIYHPDEVERLEDLTVGKRIRCHYKADFDQVGQFDGFGKETLPFISPWASAAPDGDFYWVMVDETEGSKKLIADRNIQHSVSWNTLYEAGVATAKGMSIGKTENRTMSVRLIQSGLSRDDTSNEWTRYIQNAQGDFNHENYWCFAEILVTLCFADINNPLAGFVHRGRFVSGETPYGEDAHYYHFVPPANNDKKYHTYGFRPLLLIKHE
jgi:uncharacterized protein YdcH (DUF465 family)